MAWRRWMAPLLIGVMAGSILTLVVAKLPHRNTLAVVLLMVQVPILIWDVIITLRMMRRDRKDIEQVMEGLQAVKRQQTRHWN